MFVAEKVAIIVTCRGHESKNKRPADCTAPVSFNVFDECDRGYSSIHTTSRCARIAYAIKLPAPLTLVGGRTTKPRSFNSTRVLETQLLIVLAQTVAAPSLFPSKLRSSVKTKVCNEASRLGTGACA
jgi:hypothetical protein